MNSALCVDIGTTSLKAGIIGEDGSVFETVRIPFSKIVCASAKVSEKWFLSLCEACKIFSSVHLSSVCAISVSGNGPTIVSDDGTTLLWNDELTKAENSIVEQIQTSSIFVPRIVAFQKRFSEVYQNALHIFSGPEYFVYKLTGCAVTVLPEKRYTSAYWSNDVCVNGECVNNVRSSGERVDTACASAKLPPFVLLGHNAGNTTKEVTSALRLSHSVPVIATGPDFIAAMIGSASLEEGFIYDRAGSSEGINLCISKPIYKNGFRLLPSVVENLWNISVLQEMSGKVFMQHKKEIEKSLQKEISYKDLIEQSLSQKDVKGFSILEKNAQNFSKAVNSLITLAKENSISVKFPIVVTGGQAKNDEWMKMKAKYSKVPLAIVNLCDAELLGDAIVAFTTLQVYSSLKKAASKMVKITKVFEA